jgi:DNA-binding NarL/FixJ family response regulator
MMTINSILGRQYIPLWLHGLEQLGLIAILLQVTSKAGIFRSIWSSIIITLACFASDFLIVNPLVLHPEVRSFIFKTGPGYCILNILEALIPAILLLIMTHFPLPIIPHFHEKFKKRNALRVTSIILTFYWVWCSFVRFLESFLKDPQKIASNILSEGIASIAAIFIIALNYVDIKREFDEEQQHHEKLQQQNELKIQKLKEQNQALNQAIEELSSVKVTPQEVDATINNAITRLQKAKEANQELINQFRPSVDTPGENFERKNVYLSPLEVEVLSLIGQGMSNQEIAIELEHKESYIKNIVVRLYDRLDIHDRAALAVYAARTGYTKFTNQ